MRRKNSLRGLQLVGLLASTLLISPANAIVIGAGNVTPPGLGPGDTDVTGQDIVVEDGTLTVNGGSTLTADSILSSTLLGAVSNIDFSGPGTTVNLVGITGPLRIGVQGQSSLSVSGGATVNATNVNPNDFGQNAGSTATVTITGAGTSVNFLNNQPLSVGVGLTALSPTPDAPTNVTMDILDGAVLNTGTGFIARGRTTAGPGTPLTENVTGTVTVSGQGSAWNMGSGSFLIGEGVNNQGTLNIQDGGKVNVGPIGPTVTVIAGRSDGTGAINIDGAGSELKVSGINAFVTGGRTGTGTIDITNGGRLLIEGTAGSTAPGFQAGRETLGTINVTGPGSTIEVTGAVRGFVNVGRNDGGDGRLNITAGGKVLQNTDAVNFIGRNVGATGTVLVSGVGSEFDGGRLIAAGMQSDEINSGGTGTVTVSDSGLVKAQLIKLGTNGSLDVESGGQVVVTVGLQTGNDSSQTPPSGLSVVSVSGAGSKISAGVPGEGFLFFGQRTDVDVSITDGGTMENFRFLNLAAADSTGNMLIDGPGSTLMLNGAPAGGGQAAFLNIGRAGTGVLDITNGGKVIIDGLGDGTSPGFQLGRDEDSNADGTINVIGPGSMIEVKGANRGFVSIGRNNTTTGTLNITEGGKVLLNDGAVNFIGRNLGATGSVLVSGAGSEYDGGRFIGVGVESDEISNGGVGTLTVEDNGLVKAETVRIGTDGTLTGAGGVVDANVVATAGGTVAPGSSPGDLGILGDIDLRNGGILEIEVGGIALGEFDRLFVGGTVLIDATTAIVFSFIDGAASSPELLADEFIDINAFFFDINPVAFDIGDPTAGGQAFDPALFLAAQFSAVGDGFDIEVVVNSDGTFFQENSGGGNPGGGGTGVPEPGTLAVFGIGLAGLCAIRRRRKLAA